MKQAQLYITRYHQP